jgi:hypothetical protein
MSDYDFRRRKNSETTIIIGAFSLIFDLPLGEIRSDPIYIMIVLSSLDFGAICCFCEASNTPYNLEFGTCVLYCSDRSVRVKLVTIVPRNAEKAASFFNENIQKRILFPSRV